ETGGSTAVSIIGSNASNASLHFGSSTNHFLGGIRYNNTTNSLNFWTNNTPGRIVIDGAGNVGIGESAPAQNFVVRNDATYPIVALSTSNTAINVAPHIMYSTGIYTNAGGTGTRIDAVWQTGVRIAGSGVTHPN